MWRCGRGPEQQLAATDEARVPVILALAWPGLPRLTPTSPAAILSFQRLFISHHRPCRHVHHEMAMSPKKPLHSRRPVVDPPDWPSPAPSQANPRRWELGDGTDVRQTRPKVLSGTQNRVSVLCTARQ